MNKSTNIVKKPENKIKEKIVKEDKDKINNDTNYLNSNSDIDKTISIDTNFIDINKAKSNLKTKKEKISFVKDNMLFALNLFVAKTDYSKNDVIKIRQIHQGFTNLSFEFSTIDQNKFQVRIGGSNDIVDRKNENLVLQLIGDDNYLFHDNYGNAIKKWIPGKCPKFLINRKKQIDLVLSSINNLHNLDITNSKIIKHNYSVFLQNTKMDKKHYDKYLYLCEKYKDNTEYVLSHNDINSRNIIYREGKMVLIDFEWARINFYYWDIANFFRETNFKIKWVKYICEKDKQYEYQKLLDFIYITTNFALQWTYAMPENKKILSYRKKVLRRLEYFYPFTSK